MFRATAYLALVPALHAGELPEPLRVASPDGRFRVHVTPDQKTNTLKLEIRTSSGKSLYSTPSQIDGFDVLEFYSEHLRWSADSKILAVAGGYPKHIQTYLFAWDGSRFDLIPMAPLASNHDNPWIVPVGWNGHSLKLKITGPHAGKATGNGYSGTATVSVDLNRKTAEKTTEWMESD